MRYMMCCRTSVFCAFLIAILGSCAKELIYIEGEDETSPAIVYNQENQSLKYTQEIAGNLAEYVDSHFLKNRLKTLIIVGPINGTDLQCIREMAGVNIFGDETLGCLDSLDLSQSKFVEGGNAYFIERIADGYSTKEHYIKPNCIGESAFRDCNSLNYIILPKDIDYIEQSAFEGCSHLLSINLPNDLKKIGKRAFAGCAGLCPNFVVPNSFIIPEGIMEIPDSMLLGCTFMSKIVLPSTIRRIGVSAFNGCKSAVIEYDGNSLENFGEYAFAGCKNFSGIKIPTTMKSIPEYSFYGCTAMKDVSIPEGILSIESHAFSSSGISGALSLPQSLTHIGTGAFDATKISELIVNSNISCDAQSMYWNGSDFGNCRNLKKIVVNNPVNIFELRFVHCDSLKQIILPNSLTRIGSNHKELYSSSKYGYNFYNCQSLTEVQLPENLDSIGVATFAYSSISKIVIPNNVVYIGDYVFEYCKSLIEVRMPENLKELGLASFMGCSSLKEIELKGKVQSLGNLTFSGCKQLTNVQLPTTVINMGFGVFYNCESLCEIGLPHRLKSIDYSTFMGCSALHSVELPVSLDSIGNSVFENCVNLVLVTNHSENPQKINSTVFKGVPLASSTLIVPNGTADFYKESEFWHRFGTIKEETILDF